MYTFRGDPRDYDGHLLLEITVLVTLRKDDLKMLIENTDSGPLFQSERMGISRGDAQEPAF